MDDLLAPMKIGDHIKKAVRNALVKNGVKDLSDVACIASTPEDVVLAVSDAFGPGESPPLKYGLHKVPSGALAPRTATRFWRTCPLGQSNLGGVS